MNKKKEIIKSNVILTVGKAVLGARGQKRTVYSAQFCYETAGVQGSKTKICLNGILITLITITSAMTDSGAKLPVLSP